MAKTFKVTDKFERNWGGSEWGYLYPDLASFASLQDTSAVVQKDLETSQLAREIGWSVLDVDETKVVFTGYTRYITDRILPAS
eukprot:1943417-Amphidinium_carterae.1